MTHIDRGEPDILAQRAYLCEHANENPHVCRELIEECAEALQESASLISAAGARTFAEIVLRTAGAEIAAKLVARAEAAEGQAREAKAHLDTIAKALHPHWGDADRNGYRSDQLAGMVTGLHAALSREMGRVGDLASALDAAITRIVAPKTAAAVPTVDAVVGAVDRLRSELSELYAIFSPQNAPKNPREAAQVLEQLDRIEQLETVAEAAESSAVIQPKDSGLSGGASTGNAEGPSGESRSSPAGSSGLKPHKEAAWDFYRKSRDGIAHDWFEGRLDENSDEIDQDVRDIARLLRDRDEWHEAKLADVRRRLEERVKREIAGREEWIERAQDAEARMSELDHGWRDRLMSADLMIGELTERVEHLEKIRDGWLKRALSGLKLPTAPDDEKAKDIGAFIPSPSSQLFGDKTDEYDDRPRKPSPDKPDVAGRPPVDLSAIVIPTGPTGAVLSQFLNALHDIWDAVKRDSDLNTTYRRASLQARKRIEARLEALEKRVPEGDCK